MAFTQQLRALLWKSTKLQWRSPWFTAFELVPPILLSLLLIWLGTKVRSVDVIEEIVKDEHKQAQMTTTTRAPVFNKDDYVAAPLLRPDFGQPPKLTSSGGKRQPSRWLQRQRDNIQLVVAFRALGRTCIESAFLYEATKTYDPADPQSSGPIKPVFRLLYAPETSETRALMDIVVSAFYGAVTHQGFASESALEAAAAASLAKCPPMVKQFESAIELDMQNCTHTPLLAGIVFDGDVSSNRLSYKLRFPKLYFGQLQHAQKYSLYPYICQPWATAYSTNKVFKDPNPKTKTANTVFKNPYQWYDDEFNYRRTYMARSDEDEPDMPPQDYYTIGFASVQHAVDQAFIRRRNPAANSTLANLTVSVAGLPAPDWAFPTHNRINMIVKTLSTMTACFIMLCFIVPFIWISRCIVLEKTNHVKDYLSAMGMSRLGYWLSHYIFTLLKLTVVVLVLSFGMRYLPIDGETLFQGTSVTLLLVTLWLYVACLTANALFLSTLFSTSGKAATFSLVFFIVNMVVSLYVGDRRAFSIGQFVLYVLLFNYPLYHMLDVFLLGDIIGKPVSWGSVFEDPMGADGTPCAVIMCCMALQAGLYLLITLYADCVHPGGEAAAEPWLFFVKPSYWRQHVVGDVKPAPIDMTDGARSSRMESLHKHNGESVRPSIQITNLSKEFPLGFFGRKKLRAVNHMTLSVMPRQLTVLLGHNGAGKSTTFGMLTGMVKPTTGSAQVGGYDLATELDDIRQLMGFCPQYNVLFPKLTVIDHLHFFCKLKGAKIDHREVTELLRLLTLEDCRTTAAGQLSGGQKRKLSVGIALIGHSEIVLLDEPSSGLDAQTRHQFWDLLLQERRKRTILLTTHYMEEADVLGDRIAIMAHGKVHCAGTSTFLKSRYGAGYYLSIDYEENTKPQLQKDTLELLQAHCHQHHILLSQDATTATHAVFLLPRDSRPQFAKMFSQLDLYRPKLRIRSYGVSMTTMDEVFVKVGEEADAEYEAAADDGANFENPNPHMQFTPEDLKPAHRVTGPLLFARQMTALLKKRAENFVSTCHVMAIILGVYLVCTLLVIFWAHTETDSRFSDVYYGSYKPVRLESGLFNGYVRQSVYAFAGRNATGADASLAQIYESSTSAEAVPLDGGGWRAGVHNTYTQQYAKVGQETSRLHSMMIGSVVGVMDDVNKRPQAIALFADLSPHSLGVSVNALDTALARWLLNDSTVDISVQNHPLEPLDRASAAGGGPAQVNISKYMANIGIVYAFILLAFAELISRFAMVVSSERTTGMKHLQMTAGASPLTYWLSHALFDAAQLLLLILLCLIVIAIAGIDQLAYGNVPYFVLLVLGLFVWAIVPKRYLLASIVGESAVYTISCCTSVVIATIGTMVYTALLMSTVAVEPTEEPLVNAYYYAKYLPSCLSPFYALVAGLLETFKVANVQIMCDPAMAGQAERSPLYSIFRSCREFVCPSPNVTSVFKQLAAQRLAVTQQKPRLIPVDQYTSLPAAVGPLLVILAVHGVVYWLLVLVNRTWFSVCTQRRAGDVQGSSVVPEVAEEERRLLESEPEQLAIAAKCLHKSFTSWTCRTKPVVHGVSFGVNRGECFGLLGVNGAGKTTTFKMLTGEHGISRGRAYLNGVCVNDQWLKACRATGYCPQFDSVLGNMNTWSLLRLFASLRGVPAGQVERIVRTVVDAVNVRVYADRPFKSYRLTCGGTKRRVSLGIAVVGAPNILLLDEPSSGVDPVSRRALWSVLQHLKQYESSIVLTSHSMEECDALCGRVAIMVAGVLACLGSPQYLKNKFGSGYKLELKLAAGPELQQQAARAKSRVQTLFPTAALASEHNTSVVYQIPFGADLTWVCLFERMEQLQAEGLFDDYYLSQATLEDVFIAFSSGRALANDHASTIHDASSRILMDSSAATGSGGGGGEVNGAMEGMMELNGSGGGGHPRSPHQPDSPPPVAYSPVAGSQQQQQWHNTQFVEQQPSKQATPL